MSIFSLVMPFIRKAKYLLILVVVGIVAYYICWRYRQRITPWWLYTFGAVAITGVIILIYIFWKWRHEKKMAAGLESGIAEADDDKVDLKGEIKALRDNWNDSLARLKETGGGKSVATLYSLPWYIIIGEPASGKSTLLRKSGLDFPVGDAAIRGMHGTRNCDWWFANEAIFLDTAGRYIIETQEAEWVTFLGLLKKYRKKRPINGVLVAVAANSLLTKSHEELLSDAKRIRSRIDELIDELGVNFPVYILVTKCDLISGFVEFFGPLDGLYREQMIGWTNSPDPSARFDGGEFDARFSEVSKGLFQMRPWLESEGSKRGLMRAFLFPEEFSYLQQPLKTVLENAFKANIYQETPVCRGVYFSSGTQVGSPLAMALEDMAKDLNIAGLEELGLGLGMQEEKEVRTYFIKDFVAEQVLKDREMNWRTAAAEKRLTKRRMGWGMVGVAAAAILALFGTSSYLANRTRLVEFEEHLPAAGRSLEVAVGAIRAHDEAVSPGMTDIGLNYSDELKPAFRKTFRELLTKGCLEPIMTSLTGAAAAGLEPTDDVGPDVERYVRTYGHYLYLRGGLAGDLPEEFSRVNEQGHLDALFAVLRKGDAVGELTTADLREAIVRFGQVAGIDGLAPYRRQEIEGEFAKHIARFVSAVDEWVETSEETASDRAGSYETAVKGLITTAERRVSHESPETIVKLAEEIRSAATPGTGDGRVKPVGKIADGVETLEELRSLLLAVKQGLEPGDPTTGKIDDLTRRLAVLDAAPDEMKKEDDARRALVAFLTGIIDAEPVGKTYDPNPTHRTLDMKRRDILKAIAERGRTALDEIRPHVEALGGEIEARNAEGKLVRQEGWWDTFVFLAQARLADFRLEEYHDLGLSVWLGNDDWAKERNSDRKDEIYKMERVEGLILRRLRDQTKFYENPLVAATVRRKAEGTAIIGMRRYLEDLEAHWEKAFEESVPTGAATTLTEAYGQLKNWTERQRPLLRTARKINAALWDITRPKGPEQDPEDDPVLVGTDLDRRRIFDTFVVCFTADDDRLLDHTTIMQTAEGFGPLIGALEPVAVGFGGGDASAARGVVAKILAGGGAASELAKANDAVARLEETGAVSKPARQLAAWAKPLIGRIWYALVQLTAKDINEQWAARREQWVRDLTGDKSPPTFNRIFGPNGEYGTFQRELLEPFFDFPGPKAKKSPGASLAVESGYSVFLTTMGSVVGEVFDSNGRFKSERLSLELGIAGTASPVSLKIEYLQKNQEPKVSGEYRSGRRNREFAFEWSPESCRMLRFIVGLPGNQTREFKWEGDWAVARALHEAKRVGSTYVWTQEDATLGTYEVHLKITGPTRLARVLKNTGGRDPVEEVRGKIPLKIVRVKE